MQFSFEELPDELIHETCHRSEVSPSAMDAFWARGWRHFGTEFYRYNVTIMEDRLHHIIALRADLTTFTLSRSQKRALKKNRDLEVRIQPAIIDGTKQDLFERHRSRFKENVPDSIFCFLAREPAHTPCRCLEVGVYEGDKLIAVSFLDIGETAISTVYGIFDPEQEKRSLGIYTMLVEMQYGIDHGKTLYYTGYATVGSSCYDYKKGFDSLYYYDFKSDWKHLPRSLPPNTASKVS